jgi:hypothetical protein
LGIIGVLTGWLKRIARWFIGLFRRKPSSANIDIPVRFLVLAPASHGNPFWWNLGSYIGGKPAMQICGDLRLTNICKYDVFVHGVLLRLPWRRATYRAETAIVKHHVRPESSSRYPVLIGGIGELHFGAWIQPPVKDTGQWFTAHVAVIDQFGNKHWMKRVPFRPL